MNKYLLFLGILFAGMSGYSQPGQGCPDVLDQQNTSINTGLGGNDMWQSFVAGTTGKLSRVDIMTNGCAAYSYVLSIYSGTGVGGTLLYSGNFNNPGVCNTWLTTNLPIASAPSITNGNTYTFRIQGVGMNMIGHTGNPYSGGVYYSDFYGQQNTWDLDFATYTQQTSYPVATISAPSGTNPCAGGSVALVANTGAFSYQWWDTGSILGSQTNQTFNAGNTGTFQVVVTNTVNNCYTTSSPVYVVAAAIPTTNLNYTICSGVTLTLTSTSASSWYWSNTLQTETIAANPAINTTYQVDATGASGCITSTIHNVVVNASPTIAVNGGTASVYFANAQTNLSDFSTVYYAFADPVPAGAQVTGYTLDFDAVDQGWGGSGCGLGTQISGNTTGNVILSHTSQHFNFSYFGSVSGYTLGGVNYFGINFCGWAGWQSFLSNVLITIHYSTFGIQSCIGNSVTLTASGAGSYTWTGGISNGVAFIPAASSNFTVSGSAANGCQSSTTLSLTVNPLPVLALTGTTSVCDGGVITNTVSGANTYTWSTNTVSDIESFVPTGTTVYTVTGTNSLTGCSSSTTRTLTTSPLPTVAVSNYSICQGNSVTIVPSGAITYSYSSGSSLVSPGSTTSYSVTGYSAAGCQSTNNAVATVVVYTLPIVNTSGNGVICAGQSLTIAASGADTYTWNNSVVSATQAVSPGTNSTYSVTGTETLTGCTNTASLLISVNALPVVTVNNGTICSGDSFTMNPAGAQFYSVTGGSLVVSPTSNTVYVVTGTDVNSCSNTATSNVVVNALPVLAVNSGSICDGNVFTMAPSGALSYTFSNGSNTVSPAGAGVYSYSVIGTDAAGCVSGVNAISSLTVHAIPVIAVTGGSICSGQNFTLSGSGASTYNYLPSGPVVTPSGNTTYSVSGTSTAGCTSTLSAMATVTVFATPVLSVNSGTICFGDTFTMTPAGASTYTLSGPNTLTVSPATNTFYTISGTSTAGCTSTASAISSITVFALPVISVSSGTVCEGSAFTMAPTGASTYTYSSGTAVVMPSVTSQYSVTGTSTAGCTNTVPVVSTVSVFANPTVAASGGTICSGQSFSIIPSGANTYTFLPSGPSVSPGTTTSYSITGTSTAGCTGSIAAVATVSVFATPVISVNSGTICFGDTFTLTPSGASTYTISGPNTLTVSPATNTFYTVSGTSTAGCTSTVSAISNLTVIALPVLSVSSGTVCQGTTYTMIPSGALTYTFSSGSATVMPSATQQYSVIGTSTAGCTNTLPAVSTVSVFLNPTVTAASASICSGQSFTLSPSGASTYTFLPAGPVVTPASTSGYSITGTSTAGCTGSIAAVPTISVYSTPLIGVNSGTMCFAGVFTLNPSGASTYTISGPNTLTVSPVTNTFYTVSGTSTAGCTSTTSAIANVTVFSLPVLSVTSGTICQGNTYTMVPSGAQTYTFSSGSATVMPSATQQFSVIGTSTAGCTNTVPAVSTVTVYLNPIVSATSGTLCSGQNFTMVPSGASTYTFLPAGPVVSPNITTTFSVTGTSTAGCTNSIAALSTLTVYATPTIAVASASICQNQGYTLNPGGAAFYTVTPGNNLAVNPPVTTTYSITGTSTAGCTTTISAVSVLTVYALPNLSVNSGTLCQGMVFTMTPTGASTYTFSNGSATVNPMTTTSYSVSGTSTAGCVSPTVAVSTVSVFNTPSITVNSGSICSGAVFTINPAGASTYTVTGGSFTVNPIVNTSYSVSGTSSAGCNSSVLAVSNLTVETTPTITVNSGTICSGDNYTVLPTGSNSYSIQGGSNVVTPTVTTTYTILGVSPGGCLSNLVTSTVTVNQLPVLQAGFSSPTLCAGTAITPSASGATTYTWSGNLVNGVPFTPASSITHTLLATDQNACTNTTTASFTVYALPVITLTTSNQPACEAATTSLTANGAITYSWSGMPTVTAGLVILTPTANVSFTVIGADIHGCVSSATLSQVVSVCPGTVIAGFTKKDVECFSKKNGVIELSKTVSYQGAQIEFIWPGNLCPDKTCELVDSLDGGIYNIRMRVTYTLNNVLVKHDSVDIGPIEIKDENGPCNVNIFRGVSPNADGVNDVLYIENIEQYPLNTVIIFNRWGEPVRTIKGYNNRDLVWPMSEDFSKLTASTYFYVIDLGDGSKSFRGWIELIKD